MESKVIFHDGSDIDPADHNQLQTFVQRSLDNVVADAITPAQRYAGFAVTKSGPTTIAVSPGRLYSAGHVYARRQEWTKDFVTVLPLTGKKLVAVVVWGQESDTDTRPREFLLNEETGASEPRVVPMERARIANINTVVGVEAPDPTPPLVDVGYTVVAHVLLTATGIETVTMLDDVRIPNLGVMSDDIGGLNAWRQQSAPIIATLGSDLSKMANALNGTASADVVANLLSRMAAIEERADIPSTASASAMDTFLSTSETDEAHAGYAAKVYEGVRFPAEASAVSELAIFDPLNPKASVVDGLLFPKYTRSAWLDSGTISGEHQIAAHGFAAHTLRRRSMSRHRQRHGAEHTKSSSHIWWHAASNNFVDVTLRKPGEVFGADASRAYAADRRNGSWYDRAASDEPYWNNITTSHAVNGALIAETWLQAHTTWVDAIGLYFTRLAAAGSVTVALVECDAVGIPDLTRTLAMATLERNQMVVGGETTALLTPTNLLIGTRYAVVLITAADHWVATVQGSAFPRGNFFSLLEGRYAQSSGAADLKFRLYRNVFATNRATIELGSLQLAGGILSVDLLIDAVVPGLPAGNWWHAPSLTTMAFEVQVNGNWYSLANVDTHILGQGGTIPPLLPLRVVFNGTTDIMPAFKLSGSRVVVSRPATSFRHVSIVRSLPAPSSQIRVVYRLEAFNAAVHAATCRLLTGGTYTTEVLPNSVSDVTNADGSIERTAVFNLGAAVSSYKIDLRGTTTNAQQLFHVAWRKDYAL